MEKKKEGAIMTTERNLPVCRVPSLGCQRGMCGPRQFCVHVPPEGWTCQLHVGVELQMNATADPIT